LKPTINTHRKLCNRYT